MTRSLHYTIWLDNKTTDMTAPKVGVPPPISEDLEKVNRFGIAEWYGRSFENLTHQQREKLARFRANKKTRLKFNVRRRLAELIQKKALGGLSSKEELRLSQLTALKLSELSGNQICPFKKGSDEGICTKDGGVCSLRLYRHTPAGAKPVEGPGAIRALCPARFYEDHEVHAWAGEVLLGDSKALLAREVGFLESLAGGSEEPSDVGRLDMVLVNHDRSDRSPLQWCALEIQAVYFSGTSMEDEFSAIAAYTGAGVPFPEAIRRPDYRSSGPKRLMPQLQIKVPTLRRWGKKMAVVVDKAFYEALGPMQEVDDVSNCDIAWFIVDFKYHNSEGRYKLIRDRVVFTTLEQSVEGLTGGRPVRMEEFEKRLLEKLDNR